MAETHWPGQRGVAQLVHLRIANPAREVADRNLVRTRIRDVDFLDHQRPAMLYLYRGLALHERPLRWSRQVSAILETINDPVPGALGCHHLPGVILRRLASATAGGRSWARRPPAMAAGRVVDHDLGSSPADIMTASRFARLSAPLADWSPKILTAGSRVAKSPQGATPTATPASGRPDPTRSGPSSGSDRQDARMIPNSRSTRLASRAAGGPAADHANCGWCAKTSAATAAIAVPDSGP